LTAEFSKKLVLDEDDLKKEEHKKEIFIKELGFSHVVEMIIKHCQANPTCAIVGHNMMYDVIYFYNQFVGPLPETYAQFIILWHSLFPSIFDTKVLSF